MQWKKNSEIPAPKPKREPPPEEQPFYDQIAKARAELKTIRQKRAEERNAIRTVEIASTWILFRYIQNELKAGNKVVSELVQTAAKACTPRDGYPAEKAAVDQKFLTEFHRLNFPA